MSIRTLVVAGVACLLAAAFFMAVFLPREFSTLPASSFRTKVLSSASGRDGVTVKVRTDDSPDAVIVEWGVSK
ncbi:hypothetical protein DB345_17220 [Spartobacteria bacterium LR76]|nr:hypothetical protein DB345_17220 [Spartobacteria bacterium LR76]